MRAATGDGLMPKPEMTNDFSVVSLSAWPVDSPVGTKVRVAVDRPPATENKNIRPEYRGVIGVVTGISKFGVIMVRLFDPNVNRDVEWAFRACDLEVIE